MAERLGDRVALWLTHNEPWCQAFLGYENGLFAPGQRDFARALECAHRWFIEPVLGLGYPSDMRALYGQHMPRFPDADLALIAQPIDVVGVNYYERCVIAHDPGGGLLGLRFVKQTAAPRTADREIYAPGLREVLDRLHQRYRVPRIVITENGAASRADEPIVEGRVHDTTRADFLRQHLEQVLLARQSGIPINGYFAWSLLDNFEWSEGYTLRYGIVHVDFETQRRLPKDSAYFVRSLSRKAAPSTF